MEVTGSRVILMASRALAAVAKSPDDYARVYGRVLSGLNQPAILHWLGEMFDPALAGYWGSSDHTAAMDTCLNVIEANASKVDGIKISLLSAEKEISMRRRLPEGVRMYTGDDFNYPELIAGDEQGYSHALLGIFDPIAEVAAQALSALGEGDHERYDAAFVPTVRFRAISSKHRPVFIKPVSCSLPISIATKIISQCLVVRKVHAPHCILQTLCGLPAMLDCLLIQNRRLHVHAQSSRHGDRGVICFSEICRRSLGLS